MRRLLAALVLSLLPSILAAQATPDSAFLSQFRWRSIGPANMGGRVSDVEGNPRNPKVVYAAFATGGLWKTVNSGTTWDNLSDRTGAHAISEVALAPSDTSIVWIGTGEEDSRNSISPGGGVFKSVDGGRTWRHMGLGRTHHIGRIVIHPSDPNTVIVAALGHAWGSNPERGVYKTTDGGQTWRLVKFVSDRAGAVDVAMDPQNPNHLFANIWERQRGPYFLRSGGPGSGLWESRDGGENWTAVSGNGLPTTTWGRSSLVFAPSDANVVYVIVEADSMPNPESVRASRQRGFVADTLQRARMQSGLFRSNDNGRTWERRNWENDRPFYYSNLRVDPRMPDRIYWIATQLRFSNDGGRTLRQGGQAIHVDYHGLWIDPNDTDHYWVGQDGGLAQTFDRGRTFDGIYQMAAGQFYAVSVDMQKPFWVCGGLQDNGSWCGPTQSQRGRILNQDWVNISGGDGFFTAQDPTDPDIVYTESQGGAIGRSNLRTWERRGIRPAGPVARQLEDSVMIARGDTTMPATPEQQRVVDSLRLRIARDTALFQRERYNWSSPFFISQHNPMTLYMGASRVYKTVNRGERWAPISDDLSTRDTARLRLSLEATGGITKDVTAAETHGTVVALAESPVRPGLLWAGTDDGNVWLTRNDGVNWESVTGRFPGLKARRWTSRVEPSHFDTATVYVSFDGHRDDDFHPYVFVSNDFGRTFRSIATTLPDSEYVFVITENPRNQNLLFVGTELSAYVSADRGVSWSKFSEGLPPVPVHDLVVHPRDRTLVAATHGRSIWVVDIGPLEEASDSVLRAPVHVFAPDVALLYQPRAGGGGVGAVGHKLFQAVTPGPGARIALRITGGENPPPAMAGRGRPGGPGGAGAEGDSSAGGGAGGGGFGGAGGGNPINAIINAIAGGGGGGGGGGFGGFGGGAAGAGDTVRITITDAKGDTVRTLFTSARNAPLRVVNWDLRRNRAPLGPVALRDSVRNATRRSHVQDSVRAAFRDSTGRAALAAMTGPPGEPGTFTPATMGRAYGIRRNLGGGGGGGFGGGAGQLVEPGVYLITVRFNGRDYRQTVRVERPDQTSALSGGWQ